MIGLDCTNENKDTVTNRPTKTVKLDLIFGCSALYELVDGLAAEKTYSETFWAEAKPADYTGDTEFRLSRIKARSVPVPGTATGLWNADPLASYPVEGTGTQCTAFNFGLDIKGASAGYTTSRCEQMTKGKIHVYKNPTPEKLMYHASWMSRVASERIRPEYSGHVVGSVAWRLPEGLQPFKRVFTVQAWTCVHGTPAYKTCSES